MVHAGSTFPTLTATIWKRLRAHTGAVVAEQVIRHRRNHECAVRHRPIWKRTLLGDRFETRLPESRVMTMCGRVLRCSATWPPCGRSSAA
jgi:hypothetical protein